MTLPYRALFFALAAGAGLAACSHDNFDPAPAGSVVATAAPVTSSPTLAPGSSATPAVAATPTTVAVVTANPSASPSPGTCMTPAPNAVYVAAGSYIEPTADPVYGTIYGYSIADSTGTYPLTAETIVVRPGDVVQFVNVDPPGNADANGTSHSAAGLQSQSFPSATFPPAAAIQTGSSLSETALWSTGRIVSSAVTLCYSQPLTVPASGTFYFGDLDFYASVNMRDVVIVSTTATR